jgi:hypothetical protein
MTDAQIEADRQGILRQAGSTWTRMKSGANASGQGRIGEERYFPLWRVAQKPPARKAIDEVLGNTEGKG